MECDMCMAWGGVRGLGLGFTNPGGTWGKCLCFGCGGVGWAAWARGFGGVKLCLL